MCGVALVAISTWSGVALVRARRSLEEARAEAQQATRDREQTEASLVRERAARESYMLQLGRERHASASASNPTLTLTPIKTRSSRGPALAVPSTTAPVVELRLLLPPGTPVDRPFVITLRSWTSGEVLWSRTSLRPGEVGAKPAVVTNLASDVLTTGSYELLLTAGTPPTEIAVYEVSIIPPSAPH
jgi:hypothetical protein